MALNVVTVGYRSKNLNATIGFPWCTVRTEAHLEYPRRGAMP